MFLLFLAMNPPVPAADCPSACWVELQAAAVLSPESRPMAFVGGAVGAVQAEAHPGDGAWVALQVDDLLPGASQGLWISPPEGGWIPDQTWTLRVSTDCADEAAEVGFAVRSDDDWEAPEGGLITDSRLQRSLPDGDSGDSTAVDLISVPVTVAQDPGRNSGLSTAAIIQVKLSDDAALMEDNSLPGLALLHFAQPSDGLGPTLQIGRGPCDSSFPDIDAGTTYYLRSRSVDLSGNASRWSEGAEAAGSPNLCDGCAQGGGRLGLLPVFAGVFGFVLRRRRSR